MTTTDCSLQVLNAISLVALPKYEKRSKELPSREWQQKVITRRSTDGDWWALRKKCLERVTGSLRCNNQIKDSIYGMFGKGHIKLAIKKINKV